MIIDCFGRLTYWKNSRLFDNKMIPMEEWHSIALSLNGNNIDDDIYCSTEWMKKDCSMILDCLGTSLAYALLFGNYLDDINGRMKLYINLLR